MPRRPDLRYQTEKEIHNGKLRTRSEGWQGGRGRDACLWGDFPEFYDSSDRVPENEKHQLRLG